MSWLDYLKNVGTNIKENTSGLANKILHANAPTLPVLQMADNGEIDLQKSLELSMAQPKTLKDNLLGRTFTINSEAKNPETGELEISQVSKFQPGLLNDIRSGAKENFATGFAAPNWEETKTPDGRDKGLGYRFGEGLGSLAKFAESSLGRSLLMAGLVGATGGSGLEALTYGASTGMGNQQNRMKDRAYRDSIIKQRQEALMSDANFQTLSPVEQQQKLNAIANEVNSIKGYFNDNTFRNMVDAQIAQENAAYKRLYLDTQKKNQEYEEQMAQQKFDYQQNKDAKEFALANRKLNIEEKKLNNKMTNLSSKDLSAYRDNLATLKDINAGLDLIEKNPKAYSLLKGSLPAWATNRIDPEGITTRTQIDNITAVYRKWLTGAQMSDAERKAYERFLPAPTDNYETIKAKLQGMRDSIERKNSILVEGANEYQDMAQTTQNEGWAF